MKRATATIFVAGMVSACASSLWRDYQPNQGGGGEGGEPCTVLPDGPTVLVNGTFAGAMTEERAQTITLRDLDGDGLAEICGHDGQRYVCYELRGLCDTSDEEIWSVPLDAAWLADDESRESLRFGDVDGNGRLDLCVREPDGIWCALGLADVLEAPLQHWSSGFTVADGWGAESHAPTIQLVDMDGDGKDDICGRGVDGIYCAASGETGAASPIKWSSGDQFTDEFPNVSEPQNYFTLRFVNVGGSARPDICLGVPGVRCAISKAPGEIGLDTVSMWSELTLFGSWKHEQYWRTFQFVDLDGDGRQDFCARGDNYFYCARSTGDAFEQFRAMLPELADSEGWNREIRYTTLRIVDVDGDGRPDVCGRDASGIVCGLGLAELPSPEGIGPFFENLANWSSAFADDGNFEDDYSQILTLQTAEVDGTPGVEWCARQLDGVRCTWD